MNPNNSNFVLLNLDSNFHEEPELQKAKTLSKMPMISRGDYRLFSYLGQQCTMIHILSVHLVWSCGRAFNVIRCFLKS